MPTRLTNTKSQRVEGDLEECSFRDSLSKRLIAAAVAPLLMSSQPAQRCRGTANSSQKARRLTQL